MVERTSHRLSDLSRKRGRGIVRQAVVLTVLIGKFCLQKKIVARDDARVVSGGQSLTDSGFEIMPSLVRRVDGSKAHSEGEFRERRGAIFLSGGALDEIGRGWRWQGGHRVIYAITGMLLSPLLPNTRR